MVDPASGIGIPVAFGAGLISFLSPCVLPLVPGYISAVAGVAPTDISARRVIGPSLAAEQLQPPHRQAEEDGEAGEGSECNGFAKGHVTKC